MQDTAGSNTSYRNENASKARTVAIRNLNDRLRTQGAGGLIVMTDGVAAFDLATVNQIFVAAATFAALDEGNDPYGEHDCALFDVDGIKLIWKIDYYDRQRVHGSPDPSNPKVTTRVLTVMLAEEY